MKILQFTIKGMAISGWREGASMSGAKEKRKSGGLKGRERRREDGGKHTIDNLTLAQPNQLSLLVLPMWIPVYPEYTLCASTS